MILQTIVANLKTQDAIFGKREKHAKGEDLYYTWAFECVNFASAFKNC